MVSYAVAIPILIAVLSLVLSIYTLWLTRRRGRLCMTQPTLVFLGREGPYNQPKIYLRTLLYSTGTKGWVIDGMYLRVFQRDWSYVFDRWAYGETDKLSPGSGLFVGPIGVAYNHHFLLNRDIAEFLYWDGDYKIEVYASVVGRKAQRLGEIKFELRGEQAALLVHVPDAGAFLEWNTEERHYVARVERRSNRRVQPSDV
jgi:hypothetical protein